MSLTRCLVVRLYKHTARCCNTTKHSNRFGNLSTIGLLAEIVQKRADYRLVIQMVCLLRLCIRISQIKLRHNLRFFSVSCALFLVIYYLLVHNFHCSIANVIHLPHPQYWAIRFQFFRNIFFFGKVFYQPRKKILSLFFDVGKV